MGERTIKVALTSVVRTVVLWTGVSCLVSLAFWKLAPVPLSVRVISAAAALLVALFLMQLRFLPSMTVALWIRLWSSVAPFLLGSVVSLPFVPVVFTLPVLVLLILAVGIWAAYRFYPLLVDMRLHQARFARLDEVEHLFLRMPAGDGLVLGSVRHFPFFRSLSACVRRKQPKKSATL